MTASTKQEYRLVNIVPIARTVNAIYSGDDDFYRVAVIGIQTYRLVEPGGELSEELFWNYLEEHSDPTEPGWVGPPPDLGDFLGYEVVDASFDQEAADRRWRTAVEQMKRWKEKKSPPLDAR
jgi:hypothetical protein